MPRAPRLLPLLIALSCTTADPGVPSPATAERWPAADALFRQEPRWRGADAAFSIDLGAGRALWLFGDTFVVPRGGRPMRRGSVMIRNSAALQSGADPTTARMTFLWNDAGERPASWIAEDGDVWHWPLHGIRVGSTVTWFCTRVVATGDGGPFGFRAVGWTAFRVRGVDAPPTGWRIERVSTPDTPGVVVGNGVLRRGEHVYAFGIREPGDHAMSVLRWSIEAFERGDLTDPEWWNGHAYRTNAMPAPILASAAPEFTIVPRGATLLLVQSAGFPGGDVALRTAPAPEGPWSETSVVFAPPECRRDGVLVYAAKGHPHFAGGLGLTYATNAADFGLLVHDETLYYPQCLRLPFP